MLIAATVSEHEANERKKSHCRGVQPLSCETQGIVVGSEIKGARNCGYARMEDLRCAVNFHVFHVALFCRGEFFVAKLPFLTLLTVIFYAFVTPIYLLQFCPFVLSFVFNELFKPPFDVLSGYIYIYIGILVLNRHLIYSVHFNSKMLISEGCSWCQTGI